MNLVYMYESLKLNCLIYLLYKQTLIFFLNKLNFSEKYIGLPYQLVLNTNINCLCFTNSESSN